MATTRKDAHKTHDRFAWKYGAKYDKAAECLTKDRDELLAFYDFPAEHWKHIRTSNPIERTFISVRHRTNRSPNCLSVNKTRIIVLSWCKAAEKTDCISEEKISCQKLYASAYGLTCGNGCTVLKEKGFFARQ